MVEVKKLREEKDIKLSQMLSFLQLVGHVCDCSNREDFKQGDAKDVILQVRHDNREIFDTISENAYVTKLNSTKLQKNYRTRKHLVHVTLIKRHLRGDCNVPTFSLDSLSEVRGSLCEQCG